MSLDGLLFHRFVLVVGAGVGGRCIKRGGQPETIQLNIDHNATINQLCALLKLGLLWAPQKKGKGLSENEYVWLGGGGGIVDFKNVGLIYSKKLLNTVDLWLNSCQAVYFSCLCYKNSQQRKQPTYLRLLEGKFCKGPISKLRRQMLWYMMLINPWGQNMGAEQETLTISFRANPRMIKKISEFRSEPLHRREKHWELRNFFLNHSAEDKMLGIPLRTISQPWNEPCRDTWNFATGALYSANE